ncbi:MAG TPA: chromosomal replication initiator protein DnaA [Planctomycetes bacterium]|nr:chromosomal replication initiator protein DnaA [Planctomycetota bacterium]
MVATTADVDPRSCAILDGIAAHVTPQQFETWFRPLTLEFVPPDEIRIAVPNRFHQVWIERRYQAVVADAVRQLAGVTPRLVFTVNEALGAHLAPGRPEERDEFPIEVDADDGGGDAADAVSQILNPDYTFENFVVGPSNNFCHAAAKAVAEQPGETYNPLFIHGNSGLGKTHLLQALCHLLQARHGKVMYLSCEDFTNHFINAIESGSLESFRYRYRHADVLAIDDVHFLAEKERTQEEFFHTFNTLYNQQKQIILSSDRHPKDIADLEERLVSRFKWGLVIRLDAPPLETRIAIVKKKARMRGVELGDTAAHYIGEHVKENVRELEGAVNRVIYLARLGGRELDMDLLREALADLMPARMRTGPGLSDVLRIVADRFGIRSTEIQSRKQTKSVVYPRQVCMYLARMCTQSSLEEIGAHFGGRDHTTVHYGIRKVEKLVAHDQDIKRVVDDLVGTLTGHGR